MKKYKVICYFCALFDTIFMLKKIVVVGLALVCFVFRMQAQVYISGESTVCRGNSTLLTAVTSGGGGGNCTTSVNMSTGTTIVNCGSSVCFYDDGGPSGSYACSTSYVRTFTSSNNSPITITFNYVYVESSFDEIYVYDGAGTYGTLLNSGNTYNGLDGMSYTASSGSITVYFTPDGSVVYDGWEAVVSCAGGCSDNYTYQWSTGATTASINVSPTQTTTYTVTASGPVCGTYTATMTLNVIDCGNSGCPSVAPAELGTGNTNIIVDCDVTSVTLCANAVATAASANDYTVMTIPYNPPYGFTAGTRIFTNATDDTWGSAVTLPFAFCYYGNTYTQIIPGANSIATFDNSQEGGYCPWSYSVSLPSSSLPLNSIFACYRDIYPNYYTGDGIYEGVLGAYPCRSYVLSYNNIALFDCTSTRTFSTQIVLYEGTNIIDVYLRSAPTCTSWNNGYGIVGIQNSTGSAAVVPPGRNTGSWTAYNEAWRFIPVGEPVYTVTWYQGSDINGPVVGTGDVISVTPPGTTDYTARLQYTACNGNTFDIVNTCHVTMNNTVSPIEVTASPEVVCANSPTVVSVSAPDAVSYQWNTGANTSSFTARPNTDPTTYSVTVTYSNGCHAVGSVTVHLDQEPPVYSGMLNPTEATNNNCVFSIPDFTQEVRPNSSDNLTPNNELVITQAPSAGTVITQNTTVTVTITDACGNQTQTTVEVTVPIALQLNLEDRQDILCYGDETGVLSVSASEGTTPYNFVWTTANQGNPANGYTGTSSQTLQADTYTISVTDANGCAAAQTYTIEYLTGPMVAGTVSSSQELCDGSVPAPFTVAGCSGGDNSYYVWQESSDGTLFNDIAGAGNTTTYTAGSLTTNRCYRVAYVSDNCGTVYTEPVCVVFHSPTSSEIEDEICQGNAYQGNGFNIPASDLSMPGIHTEVQTLTTVHGCDSIVTLYLDVLPNSTGADERTIVENDLPYVWNGVTFTQAGTQTTVLTAANGCDSTLTMVLNVLPNVTTDIDSTVCSNELPVVWNGVTFTEAGTQSRTYLSANGTDSVVRMTLHVIPAQFVTVRDEICQNEPYSGYGFTVEATETAQPGIIERSQLYATPLGCDSTVTLQLTVNSNYNQHFDVIACDSLIWNHQVYSQSGTYTQQFASSHGCDSVVTKDVTVVDTYLELINHTPDFCEDFEAELEVITGLEHIRWSSGETDVYTIIANHAGAYVVTANTAQCQAFARVVIPACAFNLYLPNAITPSNEDGTNDVFCIPRGIVPQIETFEIYIFDRWGHIVYKSADPYFQWDGTSNGKLLVDNTFVYEIQLSVFGGGKYVYKGIVTVL